jgi:hypothetical protein
MNYLPYCGYWFYGGANASETASFFCSWGLLAVAPFLGGAAIAVFMAFYRRLRG